MHIRTLNSSSFSPDARFLLGISQLSLSLAGELSDTIGSVHREIHRSTPLGLLPDQTNIARHIYALVKKGFLLPAQMIGVAGHRIPHRDGDAMTMNVQAAINGVFGDMLARQDNPLAQPGAHCLRRQPAQGRFSGQSAALQQRPADC